MINAMDSGISGMQSHKKQMDVIGNDIANVNTVGYKQSDVTFKEAFVTTLRTSLPGAPGIQTGLGAKVAQVSRNFTNGTLMETGNKSNLAVSGSGFFVVKDGSGSSPYLTRSGDFVLDPDTSSNITYLITSEGKRLQGVMNATGTDTAPDLSGSSISSLTDIYLPQNTTSYSIGPDGVLRVSQDGGTLNTVGRIALATVDNPAGLKALGSNLYQITDAAKQRTLSNPASGGTGQVLQGYLENSNVDLAREFTEMIVTQRGFQANSKSIITADEMAQTALGIKR
jgi:flagellar hook protein FlgE